MSVRSTPEVRATHSLRRPCHRPAIPGAKNVRFHRRSGMRISLRVLAVTMVLSTSTSMAIADGRERDRDDDHRGHHDRINVQVGVRPFYLLEGMDDGALKDRLKQCEAGPFYTSHFSISHRGAPLEFPEHSHGAYEAAHRMGAGIIECDVT